jgi:predicted dehydrogenase
MVTQNRRYLPNIIGFSQAVRGGQIGELSSLDADFYIGAHFGGFRDVMPHVLLLDMAIHSFDQGRFISGLDPVSAYCHEYNPKGSWYKQDAGAVVIFEMTGGVVFTYRGSWCSEGMNTSWECNWRAVGSKGSILWDGAGDAKGQAPDNNEGFFRKQRDFAVPSVPIQHAGHEGVMEEFLACLSEGKEPQTVCTDNIKSLAMCLAAVESAKKKMPVKVEW